MNRISRLLLVCLTGLVLLFASVAGASAATLHRHSTVRIERHVRAHVAIVGYGRLQHGPR
jgi:hypothetical protein